MNKSYLAFSLWGGTNGYPMWHTIKYVDDTSMIITGCDPLNTLTEGAGLSSVGLVDKTEKDGTIKTVRVNVGWVVKEVLERRDHNGVFANPADKVNSYFKVLIKQQP